MTENSSDDAMKREVGSLSVGELLDLLRRVSGPTESYASERDNSDTPSAESAAMEMVESFNAAAVAERSKRMLMVEMVGASPAEIQIDFLSGLAKNDDARAAFMDDPVGFSKEAGVLLDEKLVSAVVDAAVFDRGIDKAVLDKFGPIVAGKIGGFRDPGQVAWPAAVAAVAAVVAAGAAVVSAATAVMKNHSAGDLMRLKGLGPNGVRLPQGGAALMVTGAAAQGAVLGGAASGAAFVSASGGLPGGALGGRRF